MSASPSPPPATCELCRRRATHVVTPPFRTGETLDLCDECASRYQSGFIANIPIASRFGHGVECGAVVRPAAPAPPVVSYSKMRLERPVDSSHDERIAAIEAAMTRLEIKMSEREARATSRVATS